MEEGIEKAKNHLQTLRSLPVKLEKDSLTLELPKYDAVGCAAEQNQKR